MKRNGGGKLNRSRSLSTRVSPELYEALALASRLERRTMSNIMEVALMEYLKVDPTEIAPREKETIQP